MMYGNYNFANIPFLVVFMYLIVELLKKFVIKSDKLKSLLPFICAFTGTIISCLLHYFFPYSMGANDYFEAATMGAVSGLTATGCNQLFKQARAFYEGEKNIDEEDADKLESKIRKVENQIRYMELEDQLNRALRNRSNGIAVTSFDISNNIEDDSDNESNPVG